MAQVMTARTATTPDLSVFPLVRHETPSRASALARLVLLFPAIAGLAVLVIGFAWEAVAEPAVLQRFAEHPDASARILAGIALWTGLFVWPARTALRRLWLVRTITVVGGEVVVEERSRRLVRRWAEPIAAYRGIAHHIRASMSAVTHEIVLVHPDPSRTVTLHAAPAVTHAQIDALSALLGQPEIAPRAIYERSANVPSRPALAVVPSHA